MEFKISGVPLNVVEFSMQIDHEGDVLIRMSHPRLSLDSPLIFGYFSKTEGRFKVNCLSEPILTALKDLGFKITEKNIEIADYFTTNGLVVLGPIGFKGDRGC